MNDDLANATQRIALIEDRLGRVEHTLNGNGQPGLAAKIEKLITDFYRLRDSIERMEESAKEKKTDWQWIATALIALSAIAVQVIK